MRRILLIILVAACPGRFVHAHNIPNARVDRSIQVTVHPSRLRVDYEVSLSELTLTRDLRDLIGALPGGEPREWFDRYGRETGPLNAKGLLVSVDGRALELRGLGFDLSVEEHPRYTFRFEATIPARGRLVVQDTNYTASEGTSRLAVRGRDGVTIRGDELPEDVALIAIRPVWQLSDLEERRTKQVTVDYEVPPAPTPDTPQELSPPPAQSPPSRPASDRLPRLLGRASGISWCGLLLIALGLGAAHALQPGHGKTLVASAVVGDEGNWLRGVLLAVITTATHTGSVLLVAAGLWLTRSSRYGAIDRSLAHVAGFAIAAIGLWRLGRHLAGYGEHDGHEASPSQLGWRGLVGLGVAGGLVPCWDAVALLVLSEALGRLGLGLVLLVAFSLGMASVLVAVGGLAARFRRLIVDRRGDVDWERRLGIASGLVLSSIGVYLLEWR